VHDTLPTVEIGAGLDQDHKVLRTGKVIEVEQSSSSASTAVVVESVTQETVVKAEVFEETKVTTGIVTGECLKSEVTIEETIITPSNATLVAEP
jgi:hypothetical protein